MASPAVLQAVLENITGTGGWESFHNENLNIFSFIRERFASFAYIHLTCFCAYGNKLFMYISLKTLKLPCIQTQCFEDVLY